MHICHVITRMVLGGAQQNTLAIARAQRDQGHQLSLITGACHGPDGYLLPEARTIFHQVSILRSMDRPIRPHRDLHALVACSHTIRQIGPDLLHTHSSKAGILARLALDLLPAPSRPRCVHAIHGMSFNRTQQRPIRWLYRQLERIAARNTDAYTCVCMHMARQMLAAGIGQPPHFHIAYSPIDPQPWQTAHAQRYAARARLRNLLGLPQDQPIVAICARIAPAKGYEDLLELLRRWNWPERQPMPAIVCLGDGPSRTRIETRIKALDGPFRPQVRFLGQISPESLPGMLAGANLLLHLSRWEGLARVLPQAILAGVWPVAWSLDGSPEALNECGTLVEPDNWPGLLLALAEALHNSLQPGPEAIRQTAERFSLAGSLAATMAACQPQHNRQASL